MRPARLLALLLCYLLLGTLCAYLWVLEQSAPWPSLPRRTGPPAGAPSAGAPYAPQH
jgi:hypothetical protein